MKKLILAFALVLGVFAFIQSADAQHRPPHRPPPPPHHPPHHQPHYYDRDVVRCDSNGYAYRECSSYYIRRVDRVRILQQHSKTSCMYGRNWGATRWGIWVDGGCRATFEVSGWTR